MKVTKNHHQQGRRGNCLRFRKRAVNSLNRRYAKTRGGHSPRNLLAEAQCVLMMRSLALPKVMFGYSGMEGNGSASAVGWLLTGLEFDKYGGESWKSMVAKRGTLEVKTMMLLSGECGSGSHHHHCCCYC